MAKVRYRELSPDMVRLTKPKEDFSGRSSIGFEEKIGEFYYIPIHKIKSYKKQARKTFSQESLNELAKTIKLYGVCQPLSVISSVDEEDCYEVISGERRLRAADLAGLEKVPCIIIKDKDSVELISLIENIQRHDLHPIELGDSYASILKNTSWGGITELAEKIGKPISSVSERAKLSTLPEFVKKYLIENNIRSKPVFKKLLNTNDENTMKTILGIDNKEIKTFGKNILRISFNSEEFVFESKQVEKLSLEHKKMLKEKILDFAEKII